jgi:hypothetical protein
MMERRAAQRYDLSLPVAVRIPAQRPAVTRRGTTRDVSTRGLYFLVDQSMEPGAELDITLTLPAEITHATDVLVHVKGRVVRVESRIGNDNPHLGVAAIVERYDIIRSDAGRI